MGFGVGMRVETTEGTDLGSGVGTSGCWAGGSAERRSGAAARGLKAGRGGELWARGSVGFDAGMWAEITEGTVIGSGVGKSVCWARSVEVKWTEVRVGGSMLGLEEASGQGTPSASALV